MVSRPDSEGDGAFGAVFGEERSLSFDPAALGVSQVQQQLLLARLELERKLAENRSLSRELTTRRRHLEDLQHLVAAQESTLASLQLRGLNRSPGAAPKANVSVSPPRPQASTPVQAREPLDEPRYGHFAAEAVLILAVLALLFWALRLHRLVGSRAPVARAKRKQSPSPAKSASADTSAPVVRDFFEVVGSAGVSSPARDDVELAVIDGAELLDSPAGKTVVPEAASVPNGSGDLAPEGPAPASVYQPPPAAEEGARPAPVNGASDAPAPVHERERAGMAGAAVREAPPEITSPPSDGGAASPEQPAAAGGVDAGMLQDLDTLIAFGEYPAALKIIGGVLDGDPGNVEFRLRSMLVKTVIGDREGASGDEELLAEVMGSSRSEVSENAQLMGRKLLPGHPVFAHPFTDGSLPLEETTVSEPGRLAAAGSSQDNQENSAEWGGLFDQERTVKIDFAQKSRPPEAGNGNAA